MTVIFWCNLQKKIKMTLPDKSRDQIGKSQEIWNCWCIPHRMAADNAKGGVCSYNEEGGRGEGGSKWQKNGTALLLGTLRSLLNEQLA